MLLQEFGGPLGLDLHGSAVPLPVAAPVSCVEQQQQQQQGKGGYL